MRVMRSPSSPLFPDPPVARRRAVPTAKNAELRAAIEADEEHRSQNQHPSVQGAGAPVLAAAASPSLTMSSSSARVPTRSEQKAAVMANRTASIDSTVSSISSTTSGAQKPNGNSALRVPQDTSPGPQDAAALIAAAGSAEAALNKLIAEKQQAASHNSQLWRLVEKQRAMILGLNKDLEKALKEKERYRRKLKDQLAQSASAPSLTTATAGVEGPDSQDASPSSSHMEPPVAVSRDISLDTRKTSDTSEAMLMPGGRSDTPQDVASLTSSGLPTTPQSSDSLKAGTRDRDLDRADATPVATSRSKIMTTEARRPSASTTPPMSPRIIDVAQSPQTTYSHQKNASGSSFQATSPQAFSPKTRKAPPAPLKLEPSKPDPSITNNIIDASDSEYEEDPESARSEFVERGRRKTREDDDREREALARQEEEQRSRSMKSKKSKSRPSVDNKADKNATVEPAAPIAVPQSKSIDATSKEVTREREIRQQPIFELNANPAEIVRNRAVSDATGMLQRNYTAPSILSPGLPMSPRPGDRPPNSPMPRPANVGGMSIPMSPKVGLPLSPRAPRQPIPLPPQTPLSVMSPHLDRVKAYHQQAQFQSQLQMPAIADRLMPEGSPESERPSTSAYSVARSPGEVFTGLMSEEYPELLLPPNALPSVVIKTASSRMKPSRASFIAPKHGFGADDNPVFTLAVHQRSDSRQLWRVEKTFGSLVNLDGQVRSLCTLQDRLPDKALFTGHAPAKIDARRVALNRYFEIMVDSVTSEKAALLVCKFLSTDAFGGEGDDYFDAADARPDSPVSKLRTTMAGYLTKRGKNFGGWKARFFVLDGPSLKYYETRGGAHLGSIKLQNAQIGKQSTNTGQNPQEDEENQFRHAFLILEPKKKDSSSLVRHVLCAESDDERDAWVEALLQYVDYKDDEEQQPGRQAQVSKMDLNSLKSPRAQKSMNDLRLGTSGKDSVSSKSIDQVHTINYSETVAGEAPVMGPPTSPRVVHTPSPPFDNLAAESQSTAHPTISGPTNLQVIQNTGDWGMKPPPTPGGKDKKRSMFSSLPFSRGRSSSDLGPGDNVKSPGPAPPALGRGVFGVPLAEAVALGNRQEDMADLPAVVYRCIEYLTARDAVAEEGIFRLSGSSTVIKSLKDRFNAEGDVNLLEDENYYDIHAVAGLLKLYLRELPASILTRDLHLDFLQCLDMPGDGKVFALHGLVNKLPPPNRALIEALSAFMLMVVDNVEANRMNVRNLGVVFSPTLNLPGPLISLFVEEQRRIFGPAIDPAQSPTVHEPQRQTPQPPSDLRSPRKQMFTELPTPGYNQTQFQSLGAIHSNNDNSTGMIPMHLASASYQMAPQGEGGFGSLNDALRAPTVYGATATGEPTPRDIKARRRESGMLVFDNANKKPSHSRLREEQNATSF